MRFLRLDRKLRLMLSVPLVFLSIYSRAYAIVPPSTVNSEMATEQSASDQTGRIQALIQNLKTHEAGDREFLENVIRELNQIEKENADLRNEPCTERK